MTTVGLVLAAGGSTRLGRPKQLLPYGDGTLLDATLCMARQCGFDELVVTIGGAAGEVRAQVDLRGCTVVDNLHFTEGCSSSIVAALDVLPADTDTLVLLLGDQPGIDPDVVRATGRSTATGTVADADIVVCRYDDGIGHPFRFRRATFDALRGLHGDKGVWKLIESGRWAIRELEVSGQVPPDVDTWRDYERLVGSP